MIPRFERFAAIDWSGARGKGHKGIAIALCEVGEAAPALVRPPSAAWSRAEVLDWLVEQGDKPILIGLDLSPALPFADCGAYFPGWPASPPDARSLWALVDDWSAEDPHFAASGFVRHPQARRHFRQQRDCGDLFEPGRGRLRECEKRQLDMGLSPSSCFNLIGAAQVGKSSLTGMRVLRALDSRIPLWPFDPVPDSGPLIVEIYTTIAARDGGIRKGLSKMRDGATLDTALKKLGSEPHQPLARYDDHSTDAILTAAWLRAKVSDAALWSPSGLTREIARTEGWTFGVA